MWLARVLCPKRSDLLKPAVKNGGKDKSKSKGEGKSTRNSVVPCIVQAGKEVLHTTHLPSSQRSLVECAYGSSGRFAGCAGERDRIYGFGERLYVDPRS